MASKVFQVDIDVRSIDRLTGTLGSIGGAAFTNMAVDVVNAVANETYDLSIRRMLSGINLTQQYVESRMTVDPAKGSNAKAAIVGLGGRSYTTMLSHYDSNQTIRSVTWTNDRILAMGKKFGKWPGWTQRTGSSVRGIAPNYKAGGVSVEVVKGNRKQMNSTFLMPLKNGNGMGVFRRTGDGDKDYKHLYGPSVYQLFRHTANLILDEVGDNLEQRVVFEAERLMKKALA